MIAPCSSAELAFVEFTKGRDRVGNRRSLKSECIRPESRTYERCDAVQINLDFSPLQSEDPKKLISLMTSSPSLEQAGGLQRMTLRGHTGGVKKVLVTPGGVDVITGNIRCQELTG